MAVREKVSYNPGDVEIKACSIVNYNKKVIDIRNIMVDFSVYYDLTAHGIQCELSVIDAKGLAELLPIVGDEVLILSFKTPTFKDPISFVFQIYAISNRKKTNERSDAYIIKAISQEVVSNYRKVVNRSFTDKPIHEMIQTIYKDYLKPTEDEYKVVKNKQIAWARTKEDYYLVAPRSRPFDVINYLCQEAIAEHSDAKASNFIFYEKNDGWHFNTIDKLMQQDVVEDFFYGDASVELVGKGNKIHKHQQINAIDIPKHMDSLENVTSGLFYHKLHIIDPLFKKFEEKAFIYDSEYAKLEHVEDGHKILAEGSIFSKDVESVNSFYTISNLIEGNESTVSLAKRHDPRLRNPRQIQKKLSKDVASRLQLENILINITIPGNTDLEVGNMINIHIAQNTDAEKYMKKLNLMYGKTFMIRAMRHRYNKINNTFNTILECVKDSYGETVKERT